jgi:tetratricopeptide (TPR) repeat protein
MASACYDLLQAQSHVEAIECYRALRVPSASDRFHQATAHRALNDMPAAVREYSRALASAPGMPEAYINMGWVLSELDRTEEAAEAYASGLRLGRWPATTAATVHNNDESARKAACITLPYAAPLCHRSMHLVNHSAG